MREPGTCHHGVPLMTWCNACAIENVEAKKREQKDAGRYRAIRDKGIAFSAWQDENGVQWAVNGRVGTDLDVLVDEELLHDAAGEGSK
jgi:hypothetical protein